MAASSKGMIIDGIAASEAIDTSGEVLEVKGADISDLENGLGVLNYEHRKDSDAGASANDIVGAITYARKIFSAEDCEDERQERYWKECQLPFIYIKAELFDADGHPGAQALAAVIRFYNRRKMPILVRFSVEGSTIDRDGNKLKKTIARRVAATVKPANRSCISGVVEDPRDGETPKDSLEALLSQKLLSPDKQLLGKHETETFDLVVADPHASDDVQEESSELEKMITAGGYNAAPGTLTGGAALQREDLGHRRERFKGKMLAAVRDWDGAGKFKDFLKTRVPEVDDSYLDHFSDLVEDMRVKRGDALFRALDKALAKKEPKEEEDESFDFGSNVSQTHEKPKKGAVTGHYSTPVGYKPHPAGPEKAPRKPIIFREAPVKINKPNWDVAATGKTWFDERRGIIHTPRGSLKMNLIHNDPHFKNSPQAFAQAMEQARPSWEAAMKNWLHIHDMAKQGKLPKELMAHAAIFSILSPNTPVPMQEYMYSHLMDTMNHTGLVPWEPGFQAARKDWMGRDQPYNVPEHAREHWQKPEMLDSVTNHSDSDLTGRAEGQRSAFMLANEKFDNLAKYHLLHNYLTDLIGKHGVDARTASEEMMTAKLAHKRYSSRSRMAQMAGKNPEPWEGPVIPGLAPKTARYTLGMLGMGNVAVPDTHWTRHIWGLGGGGDAESINYMKQVHWNELNSKVLNGLDRYYMANHPAAQMASQHPMLQHIAPDQRLFPAFWWHWNAIAPHEQALGMASGMAQNQGTDHSPFWQSAHNILTKHGLPGLPQFAQKSEGGDPLQDHKPLAWKTALAHHELAQTLGEAGAGWVFLNHLLPLLTKNSHVEKAIRVVDDLRKAMAGETQVAPQPYQAPQRAPVPDNAPPAGSKLWKGKHVVPGQLQMIGGSKDGEVFPLIHQDDTHAFVVGEGHDSDALFKLSRKHEGRTYKVVKPPHELPNTAYVDAGHPDHQDFYPWQSDMLHGVDLNAGVVGKSALGHVVHVHRDGKEEEGKLGAAKRSHLFHDLMEELGVSGHVPATAAVKHPKNGETYLLTHNVNGDHPAIARKGGDAAPKPGHDTTLEMMRQGDAGNLHRLAMAEWIAGNGDRGPHDYVVTPNEGPGLHLLHNHQAFDYNGDHGLPHYLTHYLHSRGIHPSQASETTVHPDALAWARSVDPRTVALALAARGAPKDVVKAAVLRASALRQRAGAQAPKLRELLAHSGA